MIIANELIHFEFEGLEQSFFDIQLHSYPTPPALTGRLFFAQELFFIISSNSQPIERFPLPVPISISGLKLP